MVPAIRHENRQMKLIGKVHSPLEKLVAGTRDQASAVKQLG
jgi:hypothetical protein